MNLRIITLITQVSLSFGFTLSLLSGCAATEALRDLVEPKVEVKNVEVKEANLQDAKLIFNLEVQNPNPRDIAVDELSYKVKLNGKQFTEGVTQDELRVAANASSVIKLPIKVKYSDLLVSLSDILKNKPLNYEVEGDVTLGLFKLPFKKLGIVEIEKPKGF